jgi:hypothetical protein
VINFIIDIFWYKKTASYLLKNLTEAEEENIYLQNLMDSANKTEKSLKVENNSLSTKLFDVNNVVAKLQDKNQSLMNRMDVIKGSEGTQKEETLTESPSSKLNTILSMQKSFGDKHGIGYDQPASTSRNMVA